MDAEHITIVLTITAITALAVLSVLFGLLSLAGRILTHEDDRSELGNVLGHVYGGRESSSWSFRERLGFGWLQILMDFWTWTRAG